MTRPPEWILLDERWADGGAVPEDHTGWPHGGLVDSILMDPRCSPTAAGVAVRLAMFAADGERELRFSRLTGALVSLEYVEQYRAGLLELARHGVITLMDSVTDPETALPPMSD